MADQNEKQTQAPEREQKARPEEQFVPEQGSFGLPNSLMMMGIPLPPSGTPNSVMRELLDPQIPDAEEEADRLSRGIRYGTPNSVRRQMGSRLGSDFSSVKFHTDSESIRRNDFMGSRAYTRGRDVYFGRDGFDPSVGAHELVHTVQQNAVSGTVSLQVPFGTVQRLEDGAAAAPRKQSRWQRFKNSVKGLFHRRRSHTADYFEDDNHVIPESYDEVSTGSASAGEAPAVPDLKEAAPMAGQNAEGPKVVVGSQEITVTLNNAQITGEKNTRLTFQEAQAQITEREKAKGNTNIPDVSQFPVLSPLSGDFMLVRAEGYFYVIKIKRSKSENAEVLIDWASKATGAGSASGGDQKEKALKQKEVEEGRDEIITTDDSDSGEREPGDSEFGNMAGLRADYPEAMVFPGRMPDISMIQPSTTTTTTTTTTGSTYGRRMLAAGPAGQKQRRAEPSDNGSVKSSVPSTVKTGAAAALASGTGKSPSEKPGSRKKSAAESAEQKHSERHSHHHHHHRKETKAPSAQTAAGTSNAGSAEAVAGNPNELSHEESRLIQGWKFRDGQWYVPGNDPKTGKEIYIGYDNFDVIDKEIFERDLSYADRSPEDNFARGWRFRDGQWYVPGNDPKTGKEIYIGYDNFDVIDKEKFGREASAAAADQSAAESAESKRGEKHSHHHHHHHHSKKAKSPSDQNAAATTTTTTTTTTAAASAAAAARNAQADAADIDDDDGAFDDDGSLDALAAQYRREELGINTPANVTGQPKSNALGTAAKVIAPTGTGISAINSFVHAGLEDSYHHQTGSMPGPTRGVPGEPQSRNKLSGWENYGNPVIGIGADAAGAAANTISAYQNAQRFAGDVENFMYNGANLMDPAESFMDTSISGLSAASSLLSGAKKIADWSGGSSTAAITTNAIPIVNTFTGSLLGLRGIEQFGRGAVHHRRGRHALKDVDTLEQKKAAEEQMRNQFYALDDTDLGVPQDELDRRRLERQALRQRYYNEMKSNGIDVEHMSDQQKQWLSGALDRRARREEAEARAMAVLKDDDPNLPLSERRRRWEAKRAAAYRGYMKKIGGHIERKTRYDMASGGFKMASAAVALGGSGAALASGPLVPAAAAGVAAANVAVTGAKIAYEEGRKYVLHKQVVSEEFGITDWKTEENNVRAWLSDRGETRKFSKKEIRAIILKAHGVPEGTIDAAFQRINQHRANFLINLASKHETSEATPESRIAYEMVRSMGVHRTKEGSGGSVSKKYTEEAKKILAQKMA
ncbi:MAG: DUF4157 domain-containing protein [Anaerolineaceae bacterium]|nr:DUF4157 domain-containing protein [Anaerolineaceae bacterium]